MVEARKILFGLHQIEGIGWVSIEKIMNHFNELNRLLEASETELFNCLQDMRKVQLIRQKLTVEWIESGWRRYEALTIHVMTLLDEEYPYLLKNTAKPPWVLYCLGKLDYLYKPTIAMVGTRNPTPYGKKTAEDLAGALSERDCCVVSGLARGIDSIAHRGALQGKGGTIAVLGTAINVIYPPEHGALYKQITREGLVISEYPLDTKGTPGLFPMRNRIISGLSLGTVVVEAAKKSGSLITSAYAMQESRDVFAVPGPISSPKSKGPFELLKDGAKMVTNVEDILEEYKHMLPITSFEAEKADRAEAKLTSDELKILDFLSFEPVQLDQILEKSQFAFGHLHSVLLSLLLKNRIEQCSGASYVRLY